MGDSTEPVRPTPTIAPGELDGSVSVQSDAIPARTSTDASADQKLQFLYKALDDNQSVIRFLDAKAAFAVAVLSAMTGKVLADLPFYFPLANQPLWRKSLLFSFWILGLVTGFVVFRVIFPVTNPVNNVRLISGECKPEFFLWHLEPKSWLRIWSRAPRFSTLALKQERFLQDFQKATPDSLIACLTGEVMKVSYIRQIKADRLRAVGYFLFASSLLFVALIAAQSLSPKIPDPAKIKIEGTVEVHDKTNDQPHAPPNTSQKPGRTKSRGLPLKPTP